MFAGAAERQRVLARRRRDRGPQGRGSSRAPEGPRLSPAVPKTTPPRCAKSPGRLPALVSAAHAPRLPMPCRLPALPALPRVRHADTRHTARARTGTPGHARHTHAHRDTTHATRHTATRCPALSLSTHRTPCHETKTAHALATRCPVLRRYRLPCL